MHFPSVAAIVTLAASALAAPTSLEARAAAAAGSKKNFYLADCSSTYFLLTTTQSSAIVYNEPLGSTTAPYDVGAVSSPALRTWQGRASVRLTSGSLSTSISSGADSLYENQIAGTGSYAGEDFACFKDGTTRMYYTERSLLVLSRTWTCTADYWCASLAVGSS